MVTPASSSPAESAGEKTKGEQGMKAWLVDKSLGTAANLSKLLPTGTTLAFQTMAPAFTKGGRCKDHDVNFCFTWGLISFLTFLCALLRFTDSVTDREGRTYYGVATCDGIWLFNHELSRLSLFDTDNEAEKKKRLQELKHSKKLSGRDFMHAIVSSAVFVALAFCDGGVQRCLVPLESEEWEEFLANVPLAVGFLAGFLFMIFPSTRNGIGDDGPAATAPTAGDAPGEHAPGSNTNSANSSRRTVVADATAGDAPGEHAPGSNTNSANSSRRIVELV